MKKETYSRRGFITHSICSASMLTSAGFLIISCGEKKEGQNNAASNAASDAASNAASGKDDCEDLSQLTEKDLEARKKLGYVKESPIQDSKCGNCQLWLPPKEGKNCGNCQLFKGPVYTGAYCTYWAPQHSDNG